MRIYLILSECPALQDSKNYISLTIPLAMAILRLDANPSKVLGELPLQPLNRRFRPCFCEHIGRTEGHFGTPCGDIVTHPLPLLQITGGRWWTVRSSAGWWSCTRVLWCSCSPEGKLCSSLRFLRATLALHLDYWKNSTRYSTARLAGEKSRRCLKNHSFCKFALPPTGMEICVYSA